jgi:hypothetical protein
MADFFGHNRTIRSSNQLASSEYARITVGSRVDLAQSVAANYAQQIRPIFEIGAPSIFFVSGHAQGTVNVGRLVGAGGFFSNFNAQNCGRIQPVSISGGGGGAMYSLYFIVQTCYATRYCPPPKQKFIRNWVNYF